LFEFTSYLRNKVFLALTAILLALIFALPCMPTVMGLVHESKRESEKTAPEKKAAIAEGAGDFTEEARQRFFPDYVFEFPPFAEGEAGVREGRYTFMLAAQGEGYTLYVSDMKLEYLNMTGEAREMIRETQMRSLMGRHGLTEADIAEVYAVAPQVRVQAVTGTGEGYFQNFGYAYALLFLLYMTILLYGQQIVTSVVTEKSSKAMELLITSARPASLMFGKVLGVGAAGLLQFFALLAVGALSFGVNGMFWADLYFAQGAEQAAALGGGTMDEFVQLIIAPVSPMIFVYLVIFFMLGFFLYAFLYAAFASTASRMEEATTVTVIPMMGIVAAFLGAMMGLFDPGGVLIRVLSFVPFTAPMVMFMRVCMQAAHPLEVWASILLCAGSIAACGVFGAKLYRAGVLMYGKPPRPGELLKLFWKAKV
jgi:ABC-2 type transport system permease protein